MKKKYDVCVVGGCSIDMTCYDTNMNKTEIDFGGKGANQAVAAARAGAKTCIVTILGDDKYCELVKDNFSKNNVEVFAKIAQNEVNDLAKITITKGDNSIERVGKIITLFDKSLIDEFKNVILSSKYVVLQNKTSYDFTKNLIEFCYENKIKTILTPTKPDLISIKDNKNIALIDKVSYICANEKETKIVFNSDHIEEIVKKYPNKLITTLGEKGLIFNDGVKNICVDAVKIKNVVDTTGAGDTFCGNFVANLANGDAFEDAVKNAQYASAYKIQIKSAQKGMPTKNELQKFIQKLNKSRKKK